MESKPNDRNRRGRGIRLVRVGRVVAGLVLAGMLGTAGTVSAAPVDINSASAAELEALPGIGAVKAAAIVEERKARPFSSVEDLERVRGIGPALVAELKPHVTAASASPGKAQ